MLLDLAVVGTLLYLFMSLPNKALNHTLQINILVMWPKDIKIICCFYFFYSSGKYATKEAYILDEPCTLLIKQMLFKWSQFGVYGH